MELEVEFDSEFPYAVGSAIVVALVQTFGDLMSHQPSQDRPAPSVCRVA